MKRGLLAQIHAFMDEFPFVRALVRNINWIEDNPTVKRVDLDLMDQSGHTWPFWRNRGSYNMENKRFYLIDRNGNQLAAVKPYDAVKPPGWFRSTREVKGETIMEAIEKLSNPDDVGFILEIADRYGRDDDSTWFLDWEAGVRITVYKPPKGRSFSQWLNEIPQVAKEQLQKELAKVDSI